MLISFSDITRITFESAPGEKFYMRIPEGYGSVTITNISYNGNSGILYKQDNSYNFSPSVIGTYVRVRYLYNVTSNSREIIKFYVVE